MVSRRPVTAEAWVQSQANPCRICGEQYDCGTGVSPSTSLSSFYCQSTDGISLYRCADKSLARPGRKQARKYVRDVHDFNIETRAGIKFFFLLQGKLPKEIHALLTETLSCFLPGRVKDLSVSIDIIVT